MYNLRKKKLLLKIQSPNLCRKTPLGHCKIEFCPKFRKCPYFVSILNELKKKKKTENSIIPKRN